MSIQKNAYENQAIVNEIVLKGKNGRVYLF